MSNTTRVSNVEGGPTEFYSGNTLWNTSVSDVKYSWASLYRNVAGSSACTEVEAALSKYMRRAADSFDLAKTEEVR